MILHLFLWKKPTGDYITLDNEGKITKENFIHSDVHLLYTPFPTIFYWLKPFHLFKVFSIRPVRVIYLKILRDFFDTPTYDV